MIVTPQDFQLLLSLSASLARRADHRLPLLRGDRIAEGRRLAEACRGRIGPRPDNADRTTLKGCEQ